MRLERNAFHHLGILIPKDLPVITDAIRTSIERNRYEAREAQVISALLRPGDTVLEIGGGIGFLSAYCLKAAGAGRVVSYEANPALEPVIGAVHALNGVKGEVRVGILAEADGEADFFIAPNFWASSMSPPARARNWRKRSRSRRNIST